MPSDGCVTYEDHLAVRMRPRGRKSYTICTNSPDQFGAAFSTNPNYIPVSVQPVVAEPSAGRVYEQWHLNMEITADATAVAEQAVMFK